MKRSSGQGSIGSMVRRIRISEGLSLADLARRAGLSQSFLSQVERDLTNPSINSLRRIAQSLGCPLSTFFEEPAPVRGPVVRKHERKVLYNTRSNLTYQLASGDPKHRIQLLITMLEPGSSSLDSPMAHRGDEAGLIVQGSCLFQLGEEKFELNEGDAIFIPENTPHMFTNNSDSLLIVMGAISPPEF